MPNRATATERQAIRAAVTCFTTFALTMLPLAARGEPIKLKLAYYASDHGKSYTMAIKPFVDAVNADPRSGIEIETYPGGVLGKDSAQQAQLVRDGIADIAYVVLGTAADQFKDHAVMELPGLFRDMREATMINTRLVNSELMQGYEKFFVIASLATEPEAIHTDVPVASLRDLRGKRIRANNPIEAAALARLGMSAVVLPIGKTAEAISRGTIDGAASALGPLTDFGLGGVVNYHYFVRLGPSVRSLLMSRAKFESLPKAGQDAIRRYSGEWLAEHFVDEDEAYNEALLERLRSDPQRSVIYPSSPEVEMVANAFRTMRAEWAGANPHSRALLDLVEEELAKYRANH
ncbi:MAG TPA: TRAP transporter substrate-binding protein DctP [Xanthobacteraceae bacterium]|nr:TRAP transporter substrate-binding protein DctP [Xanthobacteraceae bacterium]